MNRFIKKAIHYSAGHIFRKVLQILFLPIFTYFMLPQEYAVYTNFTIFISFLQLIYLLGFSQSLFSYFHEKQEKNYKFTLITSVYLIIAVVGFGLSLLILVFKAPISLLLVRSSEYQDLVIWVVIILWTQSIYGITLAILNQMERSLNYAILGTLNNLLIILFFAFGALTDQFTLIDVFRYMTFASSISCLVAIYNISKILTEFKTKISIYFSYKLIKPVFIFGIIMIPGTFGMLMMRIADRYMLTYLSPRSLYDVGIYAVGYKIGMIMQFLLSITSLVFYPYAMRIKENVNAKKIYKEVFELFIYLGTLLGIAIILFADEIFLVFIDEKYILASKIVFIGVISTYLQGVYNIARIGFYIKKRAKDIVLVIFSAALINLVLNFIFIPKWGVYGAGAASIISYIFIIIFNHFMMRRFYKLDLSYRKLIFSLLALLGITSINFFIEQSISIFFIKILFFLLISSLLYKYLKRNGKFVRMKKLFT